MAREIERDRRVWIEAMVRLRGEAGAAEFIGIERVSLESERASLSDLALIDRAMSLFPDPESSGRTEMWMRPRRQDSLPWDPYPDEVEFFGKEIALSAARWRELRRAAAETDPEREGELAELVARSRLLELEVALIRDMGLTLGERSRDSGTLGQNALDRQEAWRWRQAELERVRGHIDEIGERERRGPFRWLRRRRADSQKR